MVEKKVKFGWQWEGEDENEPKEERGMMDTNKNLSLKVNVENK